MAAKKKDRIVSESETHVVLTKYPQRLMFLLTISGIMTVLFCAWTWAALRQATMPWYVIGMPMVFIGLLTNFLQPEEEWNYTPWQQSTQKYEKNIYD